MRIDLALKHLCLVKSRSGVKTLCEKGAVWINGRAAKPSSLLQAGDRVSIEFPERNLEIRLLAVPQKQLSKTDAPTYYEVVVNR
jgi:ribosomal 50S subunit-recycling heat shock protein